MVLEKFIKNMRKDKIAIIGLGYVGLPLARLFATKYSVIGFDINTDRISELMSGIDSTLEVDNKWYFFYHDTQISGKDFLRNVKYTEMFHEKDGSIKTINTIIE